MEILVSLPSRFEGEPSKLFITAHGDSGSWVAEKESRRLCGHIVAADLSTGLAYIVPAINSFEEIERLLDCDITLPEETVVTSIQSREVESVVAAAEETREADLQSVRDYNPAKGKGKSKEEYGSKAKIVSDAGPPYTPFPFPTGSYSEQRARGLDTSKAGQVLHGSFGTQSSKTGSLREIEYGRWIDYDRVGDAGWSRFEARSETGSDAMDKSLSVKER